jgi:hypothetical protein
MFKIVGIDIDQDFSVDTRPERVHPFFKLAWLIRLTAEFLTVENYNRIEAQRLNMEGENYQGF